MPRKNSIPPMQAAKMNENGRRAAADRRKTQIPVAVERRKVQRRRQIDPTTCEREYNEDEIEFMAALDHYKRASGRMFPTCSEILEVVKNLGYRKISLGDQPSSAALIGDVASSTSEVPNTVV